MRKTTPTNSADSTFVTVNSSTSIQARTDDEGRMCLDDIHAYEVEAGRANAQTKPVLFLGSAWAIRLIEHLKARGSGRTLAPLAVLQGQVYVVPEVAEAYLTWADPVHFMYLLNRHAAL